ncbi:hypothetical protein XENTR_v10016963 [Xenopus tropicalis]|nr:hypothetical protein XENTR_v10016963 [Xenopus tropicalis]
MICIVTMYFLAQMFFVCVKFLVCWCLQKFSLPAVIMGPIHKMSWFFFSILHKNMISFTKKMVFQNGVKMATNPK